MKFNLKNFNEPTNIHKLLTYFNGVVKEWSYDKKLLALAVMLGYKSWQELQQNVTLAEEMRFDQDIPSKEREKRWLKMALRLCERMGYLLPQAQEIVINIRPTSDPTRPRDVCELPIRAFDEVMLKDTISYWLCEAEYGHPFAPKGQTIGRALKISEVAEMRLKKKSDMKWNDIWVLSPEKDDGKEFVHTFFRRGEYMEIEPVPVADAIRNPIKCKVYLDEFFNRYYPGQTRADNQAMMRKWRSDLKQLNTAAGLPPGSKQRFVQMDEECRVKLGKNWHWPLKADNSYSAA